MNPIESTLKDCKVGYKVKVWCLGWMRWDDQVVIVKDNGVSQLIKVQYLSGNTGEFVSSTPCLIVEIPNI